MYYDAIARCTSVVVRDDKDEIIHGRTMDWEMESGGLDALTINVEGYDGEELIFRGISWAGMVGLFTGTNVKSKFSISINYRPDVRKTNNASIKWFYSSFSLQGCAQVTAVSFMLQRVAKHWVHHQCQDQYVLSAVTQTSFSEMGLDGRKASQGACFSFRSKY